MKISLVVPVFNEEEAIPIFYKTVREFEDLQQHEVEIVFINDGSKDATESIINALAVADPLVIPLSFTRNFGKEPALFAGLDHATGDAIIPIDGNDSNLLIVFYVQIMPDDFVMQLHR
ncbi:hypothetical protein ABR25_20360, partial [Enterobacter kobei]